jgi:hypothetical protein
MQQKLLAIARKVLKIKPHAALQHLEPTGFTSQFF